jgi:hypothetical protein
MSVWRDLRLESTRGSGLTPESVQNQTDGLLSSKNASKLYLDAWGQGEPEASGYLPSGGQILMCTQWFYSTSNGSAWEGMTLPSDSVIPSDPSFFANPLGLGWVGRRQATVLPVLRRIVSCSRQLRRPSCSRRWIRRGPEPSTSTIGMYRLSRWDRLQPIHSV